MFLVYNFCFEDWSLTQLQITTEKNFSNRKLKQLNSLRTIFLLNLTGQFRFLEIPCFIGQNNIVCPIWKKNFRADNI